MLIILEFEDKFKNLNNRNKFLLSVKKIICSKRRLSIERKLGTKSKYKIVAGSLWEKNGKEFYAWSGLTKTGMNMF